MDEKFYPPSTRPSFLMILYSECAEQEDMVVKPVHQIQPKQLGKQHQHNQYTEHQMQI